MLEQRIIMKQSNLLVKTDFSKALETAKKTLAEQRELLERYIKQNKYFASSLAPVNVQAGAPLIVRRMREAARMCGVGPMAAVAGGISEMIREAMVASGAKTAIVENGGDISATVAEKAIIGVYAGESVFSGKIGFELNARDTPIGVCTSSATVGPSLSFGKFDAAIAVAGDAFLADAAATAVGNKKTIDAALEFARSLPIRGALIIQGEELGVFGKLPELVKIGKLPERFEKEFLFQLNGLRQ